VEGWFDQGLLPVEVFEEVELDCLWRREDFKWLGGVRVFASDDCFGVDRLKALTCCRSLFGEVAVGGFGRRT